MGWVVGVLDGHIDACHELSFIEKMILATWYGCIDSNPAISSCPLSRIMPLVSNEKDARFLTLMGKLWFTCRILLDQGLLVGLKGPWLVHISR